VSGGSDGLDDLENSLDETLKFAMQNKPKLSPEDIVSFDEVRQEINAALQALRARAELNMMPLIYHLDLSPVYPNIGLTNRWQLHAIVTPSYVQFVTLMVCRTVNERWNGLGVARSSLHREAKLKWYTDEQFKTSEKI
jgi:hypothetical protein